jgi:histidinol-phosphate aminotransferase 2
LVLNNKGTLHKYKAEPGLCKLFFNHDYLFQSFFHQPVFQHISDFHVICFGKGEMAVAAYADVGQAHNAGIAAVVVDTVGEGLRHMDALNPPL